MESPELTLLLHWLDYTAQLVQRVCVVVVAASVCIRLQWVRRALRGISASWRHRLTMGLAFGGLGILATHAGIVVDVGQDVHAADRLGWGLASGLSEQQAIVGFRDTMALAAGLVGGPWVGAIAGAIAGYERHLLGGFANLASGTATALLGLAAGWARWFGPRRALTLRGAFAVALCGTALQRILILLLAKPYSLAVALAWEIVLPVAVVNCLGCVLFIWLLRDLDRDRLEGEKQEAELRAFRAQVNSHFLSNTLGMIRSMIRRDTEQARDSLTKLAELFRFTLKFAGTDTIPLRYELEQLQRYLDLQQSRFGGKLRYALADISPPLLDCRLPPLSLVTLVENAVDHGMKGCLDGLGLRVDARELGGKMVLRVADDGCGIEPERLAKLGKMPVNPLSPGNNGVALYQLGRSLDLAFQGQAGLAIDSEPGRGTEVVLTLPKLRSDH